MKQHGINLAATHQLIHKKKASEKLLERLNENEGILIETIRQLTAVVRDNHPTAPAEDWLLDNFYLIEENVHIAKRHLSRGYSRGLPWLAAGESAGLPRVYDIAQEIIAHGDGRVDLENLVSFITAYQSASYLKLGELWAIPIMLRLALIENLRRIGTHIMADIADRTRANVWADQMVDIAKNDPKNLVLLIADMARSEPPLTAAFVAEFARRLQGKNPSLALPLSWVEQRLSESHLSIEQLISTCNQQMAAEQATASNSISSLRFLTTMDWREFVETMSVVEEVLREDPADVYIRMDFDTRDQYRHVVEQTAKHSLLFERDIARIAVDLALKAQEDAQGDERETHVGYYLIDKGLKQLEGIAQMHMPLYDRIKRTLSCAPLFLYLGGVMGITLVLSGVLLSQLSADGAPWWMLPPLALILLLCASSLGVSLTHFFSTLLVSPKHLPRLDFSREIPPEYCTLVVIPTMLSSIQGVEDLLESLEIRYLTNRHDHLHFGLLTDFTDAPHETMPDDKRLLQIAEQGVKDLHEKYRGGKGGMFFLFHRPRLWNPQEKVWMGYERKRGKLADLNAFLRGHAKDRFSRVVGATEMLGNVKYVITLDTDTQLPRDTAQLFIGTMAHPLNRPHFSESGNIVTQGYAILQPRVTESLSANRQTPYSRLWGGQTGIDPYTRLVSDIYQDVFSAGSFIGKGIYDIDAFEKTMDRRFPENRILSHDLIEGCHARCGLISDAELYEEYPARYSTDVGRRHRWIRGDWQIAGWLRSTVPNFEGNRIRNEISMLSQWKIFDNLRRSLVPAALTLVLAVGWVFLSPPWLWTLLVAGILLLPSASAVTVDIFRKSGDVLWRDHASYMLRQAQRHIQQILFTLVCLPYETFYSLDAIGRTLGRMFFTHKRLLEWNPFSNASHPNQNDLFTSFRTMWFAPALALSIAVYLAFFRPEGLWAALPVLIGWLISPAIVWRLNRIPVKDGVKLKDDQITFLGKIARRTWAFFETFVGAEDHWLAPDNYQEHPGPVVAHRTSPTNIGLSLLANLAAYDFGYITQDHLIRRTASTFETLDKLDRHRGHFFNWYDTQTLKTLPPHYISTVDSGNLCGHLLTLKWGLLELADRKILGGRALQGIGDTYNIVKDLAPEASKKSLVAFEKYRDSLADLRKTKAKGLWKHVEYLNITSADIEFWKHFDHMAALASDIADTFFGEAATPGKWWANALVRQCRAAAEELLSICPWMKLDPPSHRVRIYLDGMPMPSLRQAVDLSDQCLPVIEELLAEAPTESEIIWLSAFKKLLAEGNRTVRERMGVLGYLIEKVEELARMDFSFLYDKGRQLLTIGYNVVDRRRDDSFYDLLASEARLCSFVAVAQGQVPQDNWFALGRMLTNPSGDPVLMAWDGSMFEYLMPLLVMPNYDNTLLDQTYKAAVKIQMDYGKKRGVPWGISESGYNTTDVHLNYQYRAFGVPGLGLKRGLADDVVVAPYATALALMVAPEEACQNLMRLAQEGMLGDYGFYEAMDFTPVRVPSGKTHAIVRSHMAHHQGMTLLSLTHLLLDNPMHRRFESEPIFQSAELLLQERIPKAVSYYRQVADDVNLLKVAAPKIIPPRVFTTPHTPSPEVQLLSNGRYHVMVSQAGSGYSRWKDLAVTRWHEDTTCDDWGQFCYIRDLATGQFWSNAYQPCRTHPDKYEAIFSDAKVEFRRLDDEIGTYTQIAVSPEDDIEIRRVQITNRSRKRRELDITSYAEVVILQPPADEIHPAFANLFVQTEILPDKQAILCTRRPRSKEESTYWVFHTMALHGAQSRNVSYETDRLKFIGRCNTLAHPQAMNLQAQGEQTLSNSEGSVLDPIVAIRHLIKLSPGESVTIDIVTGIADTREKAQDWAAKYCDYRLADRVFNLAWTHSQVALRQINATETEAQLFARMASAIVYANPAMRADAKVILRNRRGQSGLWGYAISGDLPIVLLQIADHANIELVAQIQKAHAYWRLRGLAVDLVIWNEDNATYRQTLHDQILGMIATSMENRIIDRPGGIFVRSGDQIPFEDRTLMQAIARINIKDTLGSLEEQLKRRKKPGVVVPPLIPTSPRSTKGKDNQTLAYPNLIFRNGFGGFRPDGNEYVVYTDPLKKTPMPWINVIANPHFGTIISESGACATWSENAHEYRLTPWHNDPVRDPTGEAFYIRDEETGHVWSPAPQPCPGETPYLCRHGFGYSVFEHIEDGIKSELLMFVSINKPVKFVVLKLANVSGRRRELSVTGYVEWVLGDLRSKTAMHVTTEIDEQSKAIFARNQYNTDFADRVAFFDTDDPLRSATGNRTEFIGRNSDLSSPEALGRTHLSGNVGAGIDPAAALQVKVVLNEAVQQEVIFRLGVTGRRGADDAASNVRSLRGAALWQVEFDEVRKYWQKTLGAVHIETPDASVNALANGWLLYQTISCRLWARNGYYQSGGAFGFRDQLQDVLSLVHTKPELIREHLLLCASRQFIEGDVQHWWHPPTGRGVRTQCADDYLWLPLGVSRYIACTGDTDILHEKIGFLEGRPVHPDEDSYYDLPGLSDETASLYEHAVRAIRRGLRFSSHGLPLMGGGDWNDGMNKVGEKGIGESIWMGFFLYDVLTQFAGVARLHLDNAFANFCESQAVTLRNNIEQSGWDGQWYLRAYCDDGSLLGTQANTECRIDSIAQSWSVLSGAADPARALKAIDAVDQYLVRRDKKLVQLLDPPFDTSDLDPGYIKGYVPGVRENGGQYTHAAVWAGMAFAALGQCGRAWDIQNIVNPINHTRSPEEVDIYKVEPYVVCSDIYAVHPHVGRGGWSWFSGSAAWFYRLIVESLMGLQLQNGKLNISPCLPYDWKEVRITYRYRETPYHLVIHQSPSLKDSAVIKLDGTVLTDGLVLLTDDQREHAIEVFLSRANKD